MGHRRYTADQKAQAVADAEVNGVVQAADANGVPESTLRYWIDDPKFAEIRVKTREERRDGYRILVALAQKRLVELIPSMEPRDLTILLGVGQDKDLLLSGEATGRTETRTWTDDLGDDEKQRLRDWIDSLDDPATPPSQGASTEPAVEAGTEVR
jgi:transposase-like protein